MKSVITRFTALLLSVAVTLPTVGLAETTKAVEEKPSAGAMVADAVVARPVLAVTTVLGAGLFIVTLPFTLAGGNTADAGNALVVEPAKNTFYRCLGCKHTGYQE